MLKQFNLEKKMFDEPVLVGDEVSGVEYRTHGEGWYPVMTEDELNIISASITGGGEVWLEKGKLKTSGKAPSPYHKWQNKKWIIDPEQQQAVISAEKSAKLAEINQKAQAFINDLAEYDKTPAFERDTWSIQREEAKAWFADKTVATPTLDLIAQRRGVPVELLRQKAYEKAMAYQTVAAIVAGQRQAYEDQLNTAETLEQVQAIEPVYSLPNQGEAIK
ncbi:hypothetical protein X781_20410 [Mannheimia sp. USDA-ARS-USMARC-1261]|uniref:hypothetical protein n=1 Tax=Mannheimia sp. USDA-ARS-USMARC-1261 TaxID=1432056 RepID=UPI0003E3BDA9|nr:hypothetical protein [Mannheimia sp. USDA-ARS-USMARC-1261]AHG74186.1 hypothetical protein X781_20410 [Mannheimia sp. USDA-ARS-USMARC-1261]